jgi:hypothetical protein
MSSEEEQNTDLSINSDSFVNQVTLQFLMNKTQFSKYLEKKTSDSTSKRERKFYSQRFLKLAKRMLFKKKSVEDMPSDIKFGFESLLKSCIHHFKMTDHTESVQAEYDKEDESDAGLEEEDDAVIEDEDDLEDEDATFKGLEDAEVADLEEENKREIKEKGKRKTVDKLRKKKNIDINYEDIKNEEIS